MSNEKQSTSTHPDVHQTKAPGEPGKQISPSAVPKTNDKPQPNVDATKNDKR